MGHNFFITSYSGVSSLTTKICLNFHDPCIIRSLHFNAYRPSLPLGTSTFTNVRRFSNNGEGEKNENASSVTEVEQELIEMEDQIPVWQVWT